MRVRFTAPRGGGGVLAVAVVLAAAIAPKSTARAQQIGFKASGEFEICLERANASWLKDQAELVVNEDPRATKLTDAAVATYTVAIMDGCKLMEGPGEASSEERFASYMAQWRQHVYDMAASIRRRGQSD